jgi:hypothetical protein
MQPDLSLQAEKVLDKSRILRIKLPAPLDWNQIYDKVLKIVAEDE